MNKITPVILCGGSGTRLWPLSRAGFPKQFLVLCGTDSLFQQAVERINGLAAADITVGETLVVTNEEHRFLALDQLRELKSVSATLLLEPVARNTAPALTLAALQATENGEDPILVVTPADQTITDTVAFTAALQKSVRVAAAGAIVILGVTPDRPESGYGYIKSSRLGDEAGLRTEDSGLSVEGLLSPESLALSPAVKSSVLSPASSLSPEVKSSSLSPVSSALVVDHFVEKPDAATAQRYLSEGGYYWNAGMFVLKASTWLKALNQFRPDIATATQQAWAGKSVDAAFVRPHKTAFVNIRSESIDYAVMEKITNATPQPSALSPKSCSTSPKSSVLSPALNPSALSPQHSLLMVPLAAGWNDLGAWDAVWQVLPKDESGNAHVGDVLTMNSRNTLVHATSRLVSLVGVKDLVVIETPDAVLVADRASTQDVKKIVEALTNSVLSPQHSVLPLTHRKVHRPWGWYDSIDEEARFKVKRIQVNPKASLSLQKHHHRAEHWVVVKGTAEVTCGEKTILLTENQSTYIPLGETHRLSNPGTIPLEIIEVQSGSYLGEDDIVRFEDAYGRTEGSV